MCAAHQSNTHIILIFNLFTKSLHVEPFFQKKKRKPYTVGRRINAPSDFVNRDEFRLCRNKLLRFTFVRIASAKLSNESKLMKTLDFPIRVITQLPATHSYLSSA